MANRSGPPPLATQPHPMGRIELTANTSYTAPYQQRTFQSGDIAEVFHRNSQFDRRYLQRSKLTKTVLPDHNSAVERDYHGLDLVSLPDAEPIDCNLEKVLKGRRSVRNFASEGISMRQIGSLLGHSIRPNETRINSDRTETFHPYPSAGGLLPIEVYPIVLQGQDIDRGQYYYTPRRHGLRVMDRKMDEPSVVAEFIDAFMNADFAQGVVADSAITLVLTGSFGRIKSKYGSAGYRFALMEAGHIAQNLLLVGETLNLRGVPLASFIGRKLDEFLDVDGVNEAALYAVALGSPEDE